VRRRVQRIVDRRSLEPAHASRWVSREQAARDRAAPW
jgi:hypothetical protein